MSDLSILRVGTMSLSILSGSVGSDTDDGLHYLDIVDDEMANALRLR